LIIINLITQADVVVDNWQHEAWYCPHWRPTFSFFVNKKKQLLYLISGSHAVSKVLNFKIGFQDLDKVMNLAKMYIRYW